MSQIDGPYDELVRRLATLRADEGQPSFGELATRVSRLRRDRGMSAEAARVGRTTVYDAFRLGRQRIDADLIGDLARALGADEDVASAWAGEARRARSGPVTPSGPTPTATPVPTPAPAPATAGGPADETAGETEPEPASEEAGPEPLAETRQPAGLPRRWLVGVLLGGFVVNMLGRGLVELLDLPVYLDMTGTACTAVVLGPWWGALVGLATNAAGMAVSGPSSLLFAPVNMAGALIWGHGVRRFAMARTIPRFFLLSLVVALVCSSIAVPLIVTVENGFSDHGTDVITASTLMFLSSLWASVTVSNLLTSVVDKLISGFMALAVVESLPAGVRAALPFAWLRAQGPRG